MERSHALFIYLHLLKLHDIYELEVEKYTYNYVHGSLLYLLCDMFTFAHVIHIYQTRHISQIRPFVNSPIRSSNRLLKLR